MYRLKGKIAVVTGGSRGIGYSITELFLREGATVISISRHNVETSYVKLSEFIQKKKLFIYSCDVTDKLSVECIIDEIIQKHNKIEILVNCAGISLRGTVEDLSYENWNQIINTNLTGSFIISKFVLKSMKIGNGGCIINISSTAALRAYEGDIAYQVSKNGLLALTRSMAVDLAKYQIRVNSISPGMIMTDMLTYSLDKEGLHVNDTLPSIPLRRVGLPEDIAKAAIFLASDESNYVTGINLIVDGGKFIYD